MHIFLDESGDLGFNFEKGKTSKYFSITLLACETKHALSAVQKATQQTLERKLNHKSKRLKSELKGNTTILPIKHYFYKKLAKRSDFKIHSIILDKQKIAKQVEHIDKHRIYVRLCFLALKSIAFEKDTSFVHIIADKCKRGIEAKDFSMSLQSDMLLICSHTASTANMNSTIHAGMIALKTK